MAQPAVDLLDEPFAENRGQTRARHKLVVSLLSSSYLEASRIGALLYASKLKAELRLGQIHDRWVSFSTVAISNFRGAVPSTASTGSGEPSYGHLLLEAPRAPELARLALSVIREDPGFSGSNALLAVSATEVHRVRPDWGFDDFIVHPYRPEELHWRLSALQVERVQPRAVTSTLADVSVDLGAHEVTVAGKKVLLTHKEFALLRCLLESGGNVLSRQQLLNRVWGDDYGGGRRTVDTHVRRLRSKLGSSFPLITVRGAGYRLSR